MSKTKSMPGVSRHNRLSDEGLLRLEKQLASGAKMTDMVLAQWIRRYGNAARKLIREKGRYVAEFDSIDNPD